MAAPTLLAPTVARLATTTAQGTPELVLVLERRVVRRREWLRVRLPVRPNGATGWVRAERLGELHTVRTALVVDRFDLSAVLLEGGSAVWAGPVGTGKPEWPTPGGRFYIRQRLVPERTDRLYGTFLFGTSGYVPAAPWPGGELVAIHGTNRPEVLPGRVSRGCIRVHNKDIAVLRELMPLGTPVHVV